MSTTSLIRERIFAEFTNLYLLQGSLTDARLDQDMSLDSGSEVYVAGPGGVLNQSLYLDGEQVALTSSSVGDFDTNDIWTIGGWFKPDSPLPGGPDLQRFFDKQLGTGSPYDGIGITLRLDDPYNAIQVAVVRSPAAQYVIQIPNPWSEGDVGFKHLVFQFFGSTDQSFRCFVNAVEQSQTIISDDRPVSTGATNTVAAAFGSSATFNGRNMAGAMAECFVADWILSPQQVAVIYNQTATASYDSLIDAAASYWPCQDNESDDVVLNEAGSSEAGGDGNIDSGANTNTLTAPGPTSFLPRSLALNDTPGDYIDGNTFSPDIDGETPFTIATWIYWPTAPASNGDFAVFVTQQDSAGLDGWSIRGGPALNRRKFRCTVTRLATTSEMSRESTADVFTEAGWYHLVATSPGGRDADLIKLYVNAEEIASTTIANTLAGTINAPANISIGGRLADNNGLTTARFAGAAVFRWELSPEQIQTLYTGGSGQSLRSPGRACGRSLTRSPGRS